jgi:hypothetical protein
MQDSLNRHFRESGNPELLGIPGFRLALAVASLAGMTFNKLPKFKRHYPSTTVS